MKDVRRRCRITYRLLSRGWHTSSRPECRDFAPTRMRQSVEGGGAGQSTGSMFGAHTAALRASDEISGLVPAGSNEPAVLVLQLAQAILRLPLC